MTNLIIRIVLFLVFTTALGVQNSEAQSRKRLKELEKTEERQQDEQAAAQEEGRQRHMDIQSKRTKKEMKRNKRRSKRYNKNRREPFWKRWFRRKK